MVMPFDEVEPIVITAIGKSYAVIPPTILNEGCHDTPYPRINVALKSLNHHIRHGG
jgi:hypothetical protein